MLAGAARSVRSGLDASCGIHTQARVEEMAMNQGIDSVGAVRAVFGGLGLIGGRRASRAAVTAGALLASCGLAQAQTWTHLAHNPPHAINAMEQLSDGTVMALGNDGTSTIARQWYKLTPDIHGSYINGTWTTPAPMIDTRLYFATQIMTDGRMFVAGGEYGTGTPHAEVYNPQTNTWTAVNPPVSLMNPSASSPVTGLNQSFYDANSEILPTGKLLIAPVNPMVFGQPLIYTPSTNSWAAGPIYLHGVGYQDESSWVKLPDQTILTIDPFGTSASRYNPTTNAWVDSGVVPVQVYDSFGDELGPSFLLKDGRAIYLGSTGHTAYYTPPAGGVGAGTWAAGPDIPSARGMPDAPGAMLVTGNILFACSAVPTSSNHFPSPTFFYEFNAFSGANGTYTLESAPAGSSDNISAYQSAMLVLPDGGVLYTDMSANVYEYRPSGSPLPQAKPVIISITPNGDGSFHLTGTGLNGINEGANYGDDLQMETNFPLVRYNDGAGNVYYARTYNWSSTAVQTGALVTSVEFVPPAGLPAGVSIQVVVNGVGSDPCAPSVLGGPASQWLCAGQTATFTVGASGAGPLTYQWTRGGASLVDVGNISGSQTATLTVSNVSAGDVFSNYNVIVTGACGSTFSGNASLTIQAGGYANCDGSLTIPVLNVTDFTCFLQKFAANDPYANCDGSTTQPVLNVSDFTCFLQKFAAGCS
jgi:Kelch motif